MHLVGQQLVSLKKKVFLILILLLGWLGLGQQLVFLYS
jgi:hypothetical protein